MVRYILAAAEERSNPEAAAEHNKLEVAGRNKNGAVVRNMIEAMERNKAEAAAHNMRAH